MIQNLAALSMLWIWASVCSAQIFYEPVQYEYGRGAGKFYYGGSDPGIVAYGYEQPYPRVSPAPLCVYDDSRPRENVAIYGFGINDARNEAYANVPCYFRKRDLLAAAIGLPDGASVVPAQAQPIYSPDPARGAAPTVTAAPILIVRKGQILPAPKSNNVVIARR